MPLPLTLVLAGLACVGVVPSSGMPRLRDVEGPPPVVGFRLPDNATSIRENIGTSFSCEGRSYGYFADTENDCQLFHVCLPVAHPRGTQTFMWSFICPQETVFNQEKFTCTRMEDSIPCQESLRFYSLNENFGRLGGTSVEEEEQEEEEVKGSEDEAAEENVLEER